MAPLPLRDQRHPWLRYQVERYTEDIVHTFEQRLEMIFGRSVNRVHVLDFLGFTDEIRGTLADGLRMVYTKDDGQELITSHAWRRLFEIQGPLVREFILEFLSTYRMSDSEMGLDHGPGTANVLYLLAQYLFRHAEGKKYKARLSQGYFIGRLAAHIGLLVRLNICVTFEDTWDWVSPGPKRQLTAAAPQPPPPALARTIAQSLSVLEDEVHSLRDDMGEQRGVLDSMAHDFSRFTTWTVTSLSRMMNQSGVRYTSYSDSQVPYQRRTTCRTDNASTSTNQQDEQQPNP
ncbi:hypothetical protein Tco_1432481, partial [Tanacetum coccineum]